MGSGGEKGVEAKGQRCKAGCGKRPGIFEECWDMLNQLGEIVPAFPQVLPRNATGFFDRTLNVHYCALIFQVVREAPIASEYS
jgi:hypothetical protein